MEMQDLPGKDSNREARACKSEKSRPSIDWDDHLPDELQREWNSFRESLQYVRSLTFKRALKPKEAKAPVLVIFSDGSKDAYGAAA